MVENKNSFIFPPYFELWQKYQKIDDLLETLHYAKVANIDLDDQKRESCIHDISVFVDAFNNEYSSLLGLKIKLLIASNKWNKLYKDKDKFPPTSIGVSY
jgi:hypothetical protein